MVADKLPLTLTYKEKSNNLRNMWINNMSQDIIYFADITT